MTPAALILAAAAATAADDRGPELAVPIVHSVALMAVMRAGEAVIWPDPFARTAHFGAHYEEAFTRPPIFPDGDPWYVNYVGHAAFGSELYLRARSCRLGWAGALAFAAAGSVLWEYGFEANGVRPSALDLVYTPVVGAALGELRHLVVSRTPPRSAARFVFDPFGELERAAGADC